MIDRMYSAVLSAIVSGGSTLAEKKPYISVSPHFGEGLRLNSSTLSFSLYYCLGNSALASIIEHLLPNIKVLQALCVPETCPF
jgi:hypothetical protein